MECKQMYNSGLRVYLLDNYNWIDFVVLSLYLASYVLRFLVDHWIKMADKSYNGTARAREALSLKEYSKCDQIHQEIFIEDQTSYFMQACECQLVWRTLSLEFNFEAKVWISMQQLYIRIGKERFFMFLDFWIVWKIYLCHQNISIVSFKIVTWNANLNKIAHVGCCMRYLDEQMFGDIHKNIKRVLHHLLPPAKGRLRARTHDREMPVTNQISLLRKTFISRMFMLNSYWFVLVLILDPAGRSWQNLLIWDPNNWMGKGKSCLHYGWS